MSNIKFAHIAPTQHIFRAAAHSKVHMALTHLVLSDWAYRERFLRLSGEQEFIYLDNSQFELGRALTLTEVLKAANLIGASCIILPDGDLNGLQRVKDEGYDVMYIPAHKDLEADFFDAIYNDDIDFVGLSASKTSQFMGTPRHSYTSRFDFLNSLGLMLPPKKIHMLGANVIAEIALMRPYKENIYSWDSSIAVWAGLNNTDITQLKIKNTMPVDFDSKLTWKEMVDQNIKYIDNLLCL